MLFWYGLLIGIALATLIFGWSRVEIAKLLEVCKAEKLETAKAWFNLGWETAEAYPLFADSENYFHAVWKRENDGK